MTPDAAAPPADGDDTAPDHHDPAGGPPLPARPARTLRDRLRYEGTGLSRPGAPGAGHAGGARDRGDGAVAGSPSGALLAGGPTWMATASSTDLALGGLALLLGVAAVPSVLNLGLITVRIALLALTVGPGLWALADLAVRRDRAAQLAIGFLAWAFASSLASDLPRVSLLGSYGLDHGWIYDAAYLGLWALGRRVAPAGERLVARALLAAVALNGLVAVAQILGAFEGTAMAAVDGRAHGITPNAVFLGGYAAGGIALAAYLALHTGARRWWALLPVVGLMGATANLSGSRSGIAFGLVLVAAVGGAAVRRDRVLARRAALVLAATVAGVLLSLALPQTDGTTTSRLADSGSGGGVKPRLIMWEAGARATAERPLLGWGPGRFRPATQERVTAEFTRLEGPDKLYFDAHNLVVETLTATGVPGLLLALGFAFCAIRRARGPLAWFAGGLALTCLLTAMAASTGPLLLLALGAAGARSPDPDPERAPGLPPLPAWARAVPVRAAAAAVVAVLVLAGGFAGARLLQADRAAQLAVTTASLPDAQRAQTYLPPDTVLSDLEQQAATRIVDLVGLPAYRRAALAAARRTVRLDESEPLWWINLGYAEANAGTGKEIDDPLRRQMDEEQRIARAQRAFREALRRNPWSVGAMIGLQDAAVTRADRAQDAIDDLRGETGDHVEAFRRAKRHELAEAEADQERWARRLCEAGFCGDQPAPED
jgi:O-antigen ligase